jgi:peroxiredoxin
MPDFALPDVALGRVVKRDDFIECHVTLVVFLSAQCPASIHARPALIDLWREYSQRRVGLLAICANDAAQIPGDAPPRLAAMARAEGFKFPVLYDASQSIAKAFHAACTPDFLLFDSAHRLAYRGQLDASRPAVAPGRSIAADGRDIRAALDAILAGWPANPDQRPSTGSPIYWKPGNAPAYQVG